MLYHFAIQQFYVIKKPEHRIKMLLKISYKYLDPLLNTCKRKKLLDLLYFFKLSGLHIFLKTSIQFL